MSDIKKLIENLTHCAVVFGQNPFDSHVSRRLSESQEALNVAIKKLVRENKRLKGEETPEYTTGHCQTHKSIGGCQLHNVQCGYPQCDRRNIDEF